MCTGLEIAALAASAAATVGGGMYNARQAEKAQANEVAARNHALALEQQRQQKYQQEQDVNRTNLLKQTEQPAQEKRQAENEAQRTQEITAALPEGTAGDIPLQGSAPEVVKSELAKRMLEAHQGSTERAKSQARLSAFGDSWLQNGFDANDVARKVDTVNNFSRGQAALLPASSQMYASMSQKPPSQLGNIMQGLGGVGAMAVGSGKLGGANGGWLS
jgi:hypothetical protein